MTKREIAELAATASRLVEYNENYEEKLIAIISSSFSALATANPNSALDIIEQLNGRKNDIQKVKKQNEDSLLVDIETITKKLSSSGH